ncbi:MAG: ABC transporter substrate-binding protein [Clostridiales bacterium]|nr:ABC transporter substrate-binding protein [Clostridiales bacterium]
MKKKALVCLFILLFLFSSCSGEKIDPKDENRNGITVTDTVGRTVSVPSDPKSICCIDPFSGSLTVMFGKGKEITSTCNNVTRSVLLDLICPGTADITVVKNSGSVNAEEILKKNTDLIIVNDGTWDSDDERKKLELLDIPIVVIGFTDIEGQFKAIKTVGEALGNEEEADEYIEFYKNTLRDIKRATAKAPESERPRLYHSVNEAVRTDYEGSVCAEWISYTGAVNVALTDKKGIRFNGEKAYTTLEQIYVWNPDLIICNEPGVDGYILSDEKWRGLDAVKNKRVYGMPVGTSRMGHPTSTEIPLAAMWLENLLYPEYYDIDFKKELYDYFLKFYDYEMSDELLDAVITGTDMRIAKPGNKME